MRILTVIPARYASTRFPGKPLAKIGDKEMILHVLERASRISPSLYVATDDERIASCVRQVGYEAIMTSSDLRSGTERCIQAYEQLGQEADILVNLQGDEPFIAAEHIELLLSAFEDPEVDIATLAQPFGEECSDEELANPNAVKVVRGQRGEALYFSRSVIPYLRGAKESWARQHRYLKHIGLPHEDPPPATAAPRLPAGARREPGAATLARRWLSHTGAVHRARDRRYRHARGPRGAQCADPRARPHTGLRA